MAEPSTTFSIDFDSPIAVYVQIENQVQFAIASGAYRAGVRLPSVREMTERLNVNPNTITKAYRELELLEIVRSRRGVGVMVTNKAPALCRSRAKKLVQRHLHEAIAECRACGYASANIRKMVEAAIKSGNTPYEPS